MNLERVIMEQPMWWKISVNLGLISMAFLFKQCMAIKYGKTYDKWYSNVDDCLETVCLIENCVKFSDNIAPCIVYN